MRGLTAPFAMLLLVWGTSAAICAGVGEDPAGTKQTDGLLQFAAAGRTCKQVSSCREAVELWCSGYTRADGDHDGIPCENVCHSLGEVEKIRREIGC